MDDLRALASELHRVYHLQDVDAGHPIMRAHDALLAADVERDALAADAARYRWLRNEASMVVITAPAVFMADEWGAPAQVMMVGDQLDKAIDAALAKETRDE
jgi:predicted RNase H-like nuclease (RuvC/YqgF family)